MLRSMPRGVGLFLKCVVAMFLLWAGAVQFSTRVDIGDALVLSLFFGAILTDVIGDKKIYQEIWRTHTICSLLTLLFLVMAGYEVVLLARFPADAMFSNHAIVVWLSAIFATAAAGVCMLVMLLKECILKRP